MKSGKNFGKQKQIAVPLASQKTQSLQKHKSGSAGDVRSSTAHHHVYAQNDGDDAQKQYAAFSSVAD